MEITLDTETIRMIHLFESITHLSVKDCLIFDDTVYFLLDENQKIENNGVLKTLENMMKKRIVIFNYNPNIIDFLKSTVRNLREIKIRNEKDRKIVEITVDSLYKSKVIGKNGKNINALRKILKRNYDIDNLVVR
ncbi:MAG: NusA-like transcription termination signal-binding factor [Candidatus Aenigmatarchaeota archaeon]